MEEFQIPRVLISFTSPTCAGKSHLFNYIRDVEKLSCLISATTRKPRTNEVDGVDYYFMTEENFKVAEAANGFIEVNKFGSSYYGTTWSEFAAKAIPGFPVFFIVDPNGIKSFEASLDKIGGDLIWLKYYIHTNPEVRLQRFHQRVRANLEPLLNEHAANGTQTTLNSILSAVDSHLDRLTTMFTEEYRWGHFTKWDRTLFGEAAPEENLKIIQRDVQRAFDSYIEKRELSKVRA